ncbi:hypothetical protein CBS101457_001972 [Exobasidium rhododendri]|nr:hypothetical protein CBS101457_001972 [Exobasidium rhododendri]
MHIDQSRHNSHSRSSPIRSHSGRVAPRTPPRSSSPFKKLARKASPSRSYDFPTPSTPSRSPKLPSEVSRLEAREAQKGHIQLPEEKRMGLDEQIKRPENGMKELVERVKQPNEQEKGLERGVKLADKQEVTSDREREEEVMTVGVLERGPKEEEQKQKEPEDIHREYKLSEAHDSSHWQTVSWPADGDADREGRIRKRNRPPVIPLRERTFYGCSSIDQYNLGVKLGQGTFGEVKKASHFLTGVEVALKKVTIHEEKDGMPITAIREIKLLKKVSHASIIAVIDMAYRASGERGRMGEVFMVEPYMDHDLNGMLENPSIHFTPSQIKLYMKQLFEGTLYMHQNKIMHRDMKAANLLINNKGQLQIADFGLARPFHDPGKAWDTKGWQGGTTGYTSMVVTRWYRPPELLAGDRKYGPPIDMWGLGCILAEMINRKPIFQGSSEIDQLELISKICGSPNEASYPGWNTLPGVKNADPNGRLDQEPDVPGRHDFGQYPRRVFSYFTTTFAITKDWADLIDKLLVLDPCKRLTAKEALEHEWFWQTPYPADPDSLPTYQASKELDRQRRDQQKHQQRAAQAQYVQQQHHHQQQQQFLQQQQQQQQQQQHHAMTMSGKPGMASGHPMGQYGIRPSNGSSHHNHNVRGGYHGQQRPPNHGSSRSHMSGGRPMPMMNVPGRSNHASQDYPGAQSNKAFNPYDEAY